VHLHDLFEQANELHWFSDRLVGDQNARLREQRLAAGLVGDEVR
jgi:hypothetical protein